jgi:folylpolyglutamate synthase
VRQVDVAVIEVGLGGRLDPTNIVAAPAVCAVTALGLEHTAILGNTLAQIATEKAGIFKVLTEAATVSCAWPHCLFACQPGSVAVTAPQPTDALRVLQQRARQVGIPLLIAPPVHERTMPARRVALGAARSATAAEPPLTSARTHRTGGRAPV